MFLLYLISKLITDDAHTGPFGVLVRLRAAAGVYARGADGRPAKQLGRLLVCPYCVSVWLGILALLFCAVRGQSRTRSNVLAIGGAVGGVWAMLDLLDAKR